MSDSKGEDELPIEVNEGGSTAPVGNGKTVTPAPRTTSSPSNPGVDTRTLPEARLPTPSSGPGRTISGVIDPLLGSVLDDRYRMIRRLGTGGMATVYLAEHMFIGRKVAIKVLHPQLAADDNFVRRFLNEGRAAGTLGHPNIIASTDMGTTPLGQPYLVLEYLEGKDLAQVVERDGALPPVRAARVGVQVASALSAAHAAKIIHRDLKAENIFLLNRNDRRDEVRVIDFGISKFGSTQATFAGLLIGTPQYMSPEQLSNPSEVDERADIYALGVIMFQMLTGRLPFTDPTIPGLVAKITNESPPDLGELAPSVPQGLARLVATALAKNPTERPESMPAFEEQLSRYANLSSPSLETPAVDLQPVGMKSPKKSLGVPLIAAAAVLFLGIAAMVLKPWQSPQQVAETPPAPKPVVVAEVKPPAPSPAAGIAAAPEVAPAVAKDTVQGPVTVVHLKVSSPVKKARVAFRGRVFMLPLKLDIKPGANPESIEVTAPGYAGRRFWVTFDKADLELQSPLARGAGVVEASETETAVALGNAPPEALEVEQPAVGVVRRPKRDDRPGGVAAPGEPEKTEKPKAGPVSGELQTPPPPMQPVAPKDPPKEVAKVEPPPAPIPVPAPAPAEPEKPKDLTAVVSNPFEVPELRNAINSQVSTLKGCAENARKDNSDFSGSVTLTMELNPDGSILTASANAGPGNGKFVACVLRTVRKWSFPKPSSGGKVRMVFPLFLG